MDALPTHVEYLEREAGQERETNHIRDALRILRKQWFLVLVPLLCVLGVVFVLTKRKPPIYEASTRIRLMPKTPGSTGSPILQSILAGQEASSITTQVEILRSPELMYRALPQQILAKGEPQVAVSQVPDAEVIDLTVWWQVPTEGAEIANRLADTYAKQVREENMAAISAARKYVVTQINDVKPRLDRQMVEMKRFQEANGVVELTGQTSQAVAQLATMQAQREAAEALLAATNNKIPRVESVLRGIEPKIVASWGFAKNPHVAVLDESLKSLEVKKAELLVEYSETSPNLKPTLAQIEEVKKQIKELLGSKDAIIETGTTKQLNPEFMRLKDQLTDLRTDRMGATAQIAALRKVEGRQEQVLATLPRKQFQLANLQRGLNVLDKSYQDLLQQEQSLGVAESAQVSNVRILTRATAGVIPVSPNWKVNMTMAAVLGLLLGVGMAFVREYMGDTVDTSSHVGAGLGLPVIGAVPSFRRLSRPTLQRRDVLTPEMEAYHFIASALPMGHRDSSARTLLLTSAGSGQGNTTTAANLATAFAQRQKAVVLVDLDLRKPTLHALFQLDEGPGISDVIAGRRLLAEALHPTGVEGLLVMPAGTCRENPIRTLSSPTLPVVLQDLANVADVVLIDSPPCVTVTDASIIAPSVDGTILLLRACQTDKRTALRAKSLLNSVGASLLGVILNRASFGLEGFAYARHYRRLAPPALGPGA